AMLKKQFQLAEEKLTSLEASLDRIQNFTKKLNLITNVEDEERILNLAMTPNAKDGVLDTTSPGNPVVGSVTRLPSSEFMIRAPQPMEQPVLNEKSGELDVARDRNR